MRRGRERNIDRGTDKFGIIRCKQGFGRPFHPKLANYQHYLPETLVRPLICNYATQSCRSVLTVNLALPGPGYVQTLLKKQCEAWKS
tara:strand:- start:222 stop:482 length:261 start_codon:yes stop_codon:yes gene_type:complete